VEASQSLDPKTKGLKPRSGASYMQPQDTFTLYTQKEWLRDLLQQTLCVKGCLLLK